MDAARYLDSSEVDADWSLSDLRREGRNYTELKFRAASAPTALARTVREDLEVKHFRDHSNTESWLILLGFCFWVLVGLGFRIGFRVRVWWVLAFRPGSTIRALKPDDPNISQDTEGTLGFRV